MIIELMHRCTDTFCHFVGYQLQCFSFCLGTKQSVSRTDKEMVAVRLLNDGYFAVNRCRYM